MRNHRVIHPSFPLFTATLAVLAAMEGCKIYDINDALARQPAADGGPVPAGDAGPTLRLSENCDLASAPVVESSSTPSQLTDTALLTDNVSDISNCGVTRELRGADGFLAVRMAAGEKWHFHVHGTAEQDLALYLLSSCDARDCS